MFISHTKKILFFEVPRTASRSITKALTSIDPRSPTALVRAIKRNLQGYHVYSPELKQAHADYTLFAAHRNPYARVRSHYLYRRQRGNPDVFKSYTFSEYIDWICSDVPQQKVPNALVDMPIVEMLPYSDVNFWLSYEHLERDWIALGAKLGGVWPKLPSINSSDSKGALAMYNDRLAEQIAHRFEQDFDIFGYEIDSWKELN